MKYIIVLVAGLWMLCSTVYADLKNEPKDLFQSLEIEDLKKEVGALRAELNQMKEEFKLIKINSGRMVEQMNTLTKLAHEIKKSPKIAEQTQSKTIYVPYQKSTIPQPPLPDPAIMMEMMDMNKEMRDINSNLQDIHFQLLMNSGRRR